MHENAMHCIKGFEMQRVVGEFGGRFDFLDLPDPETPLIGDLRWGAFEHPLTPGVGFTPPPERSNMATPIRCSS
jgi:hypothetical protein